MLPTKFQDNWPFGSGEEVNIYFQDGGHGGHLGFDWNDFSYFCSTITPMLPIKFQKKYQKIQGCHYHKPQPFQDTKRKRKQIS